MTSLRFSETTYSRSCSFIFAVPTRSMRETSLRSGIESREDSKLKRLECSTEQRTLTQWEPQKNIQGVQCIRE